MLHSKQKMRTAVTDFVAGRSGGSMPPAARDTSSLNATLLLLLFLILAVPVAAFFAMKGELALLLLACLGMAAMVILLRNPEWATLLFTFILYANLAVVAYRFHGVPKAAAAALPALLLIPIFHYVVQKRQRFILDRALGLVLIFLITQLVASFFAHDVRLALGYVGALIIEGVVLFFLVINSVRSLQGLQRMIWSLLFACTLMAGITVLQEVTNTYYKNYGGLGQRKKEVDLGSIDPEAYSGARRAYGPIGEQNRYAQVLAVILPLGIFAISASRSRRQRWLAIAATVTTFAGVVLTFSRSTFVILILIVILMMLFRIIKPWRVLIAAVLAAVYIAIAMPEYVQRMSSIVNIPKLLSGEEDVRAIDSSFRGRFAENVAAFKAFVDHPLVGVGPANFPRYFVRKYGNELGLKRLITNRRAHNLYLEIAADSGVIGLGAFLAIVLYLAVRLLQARSRWLAGRPDLANLATACFLSLSTYLGTGLFLHLSFQRYFWFLIAICAVAARLLHEADSAQAGVQTA